MTAPSIPESPARRHSPAARRSRGEGSLSLRRDGRWQAQRTLPDGRRQTFYGRTRQEAHDKMKAAESRAGQQGLVTAGDRTVANWLEQWLADEIAPSRATSPRTYEAYEIAVRRRLVPELGQLRLDELHPAHIQRAYTCLAERYAPKTVNFTHTTLSTALKAARRIGLIAVNPCDNVKPPPRPDGHAGDRAFSVDQLRQLDQAMVGQRFEPVWRFLLGTGVRWGEAAALRWSDVDLTPGGEQVHIQRAATRVPGTMLIKAPKTREGRRTLPIGAATTAALKLARTQVKELRLAAGPAWEEHDLVFPNDHGALLRNNRPLATFKKLLAAAGLPQRRLHDLRHTYATLLFGRGVHPRVAQDLLGHSRINMTLDLYTESVPAASREAVLRLDDVFVAAAEA
jgi:integrase